MSQYRIHFCLPPLSAEQALLLEQTLEEILLAIDKNYGDGIAELQAHLAARPSHHCPLPHNLDDLDDIF